MLEATLTVWKFDNPYGAGEAGKTLEKLAYEDIITLNDAAIVSWRDGDAKPGLQQAPSAGGTRALGTGFWGMLLGVIFFVPLLGAPLGAATGALADSLADVGIDEGFINKVREHITPGTSALFVMISEAVVDKVEEAFKRHEPSELISIKLSEQQESALHNVFGMN